MFSRTLTPARSRLLLATSTYTPGPQRSLRAISSAGSAWKPGDNSKDNRYGDRDPAATDDDPAKKGGLDGDWSKRDDRDPARKPDDPSDPRRSDGVDGKGKADDDKTGWKWK